MLLRDPVDPARRQIRPSRAAAAAIAWIIVLVGACGGAAGSPGVGNAPATATASARSTAGDPSESPAATSSPDRPTAAPFEPLGPLPTRPLDGATAAGLQAPLDAAVARGAPDAIAAVITEDGSWAGAAGIAGQEGRRATPQDEFAIASITKTFTAALVLRLAEQGRIDLDAPLATYLGDLPADANGATVRQALEMRAGLADYGSDSPDRIVADPAHRWTKAEMIGGYLPPVAEPGTWSYSSPGYELLGFAAEHVTGMSYGAALRALILDPVHADRILGQGDGVVTPQPWALPINEHLGRFEASDMGAGGALSCISSASFGLGAGSAASDAPSLAAWAWHLFAGDILDADSLRLMTSGGAQFAYGLEAAPYSGGAIGISGAKTGYGSQVTLFPESRAIIVIFVNDPNFIVEPTVNALLTAATSS